jgi:HD-GYP domain-containing protein (c-di-GMP phosphodiesterase class II)
MAKSSVMQRIKERLSGATSKPETASSQSGDESYSLAKRLSREFSAPTGLIDPRTWVWRIQSGAELSSFPELNTEAIAVLKSTEIAQGRVTVWRPTPDASPIWLLLKMPRAGGGDWLALIGFAASVADGEGWGPVCPEPALRAWGQSVAERYRNELEAREVPEASVLRSERGERLLIARLTRRLKISDPPERYQSLAVNALRNALGVGAVAWVPSHHAEAVVISGEVEGLNGNAYRSLVPTSRHETVTIVNDWQGAPQVGLKRFVAVAADSQGSGAWLIAANPDDGRPFDLPEIEVLQPVASLIATQQGNARLYADLKELLFGVIRALTAAVDAKDPYTSGHSERVARIAVRLAEELGMTANQRSDLYLIGLLHDVGKIGIDDSVLKKTGPLNPDEFRVIQSHVEIGVHILADLKKLHHLLPGVLHHHESLDGTGYPAGLAGEAIPFEARILAVADSFDAMSSTRPYRKRLTPSQIDEIFRDRSGVQWDPKVIDALFACRAEIDHIRQKGLGESLQVVVNDTLGRM